MRIGRMLIGLLLVIGTMTVGTGTTPTAVEAAVVSPGPPFCPPGSQPGDSGCLSMDGGTIEPNPSTVKRGGTFSFARSIPAPPCENAESTNCYNGFSNPSYQSCVVMNGPQRTDFEPCDVFVELELSNSGFWVRPGTLSPSLGCEARFNEAFYAGGTLQETFSTLAPPRLSCDLEMRADWRPIPRLDGPTWMLWSFTYDICEVAGEREFGNGFGCLQSRRESAGTWIRLDEPGKVTPEAGCEATATETIPSRITITDTSTLDTSLGDTLTSELFWSGGSTTERSAVVEVDFPGSYAISAKAEASPSGTSSTVRCDVVLPYPKLGGRMTVEPAAEQPGADVSGTDYDVTVSVSVDEFGHGDIVLRNATVAPAGGLEILSQPVPLTAGERIAWGDDPIDYTFRVRADPEKRVPVSFTLLNDHEDGRKLKDVFVFEFLGEGDLLTASAPVRLLDTRENGSTIDGLFEGIGVRQGGSTTPVQVTGRADIPEAATAAAVTLTSVRPGQRGFATLFPCDADRPDTSTLNFTPAGVTGNSATVLLSGDGEVCLYTSSPSEFTLDFGGWVGNDPAFRAIVPARLFESRDVATGTVDGVAAGGGRLAAGSTTRIPVAGRGGVSADAIAVMVNATAIRPSARGYLTLFPCTDDPPNASSLNYPVGRNIANAAMVSLSDEGELCVFTLSEIDFAMDVTAVVEESSQFQTLVPLRLLDSRANGETADGQLQALGPLQADTVTVLPVASRSGISASTRAVTVNVTAIRPVDRGFVTLYPCDAERPTTSSLNFAAGEIRGTSSVIGLDGEAGTLCVYVNKTTHLTIDVSAAFVDPTA